MYFYSHTQLARISLAIGLLKKARTPREGNLEHGVLSPGAQPVLPQQDLVRNDVSTHTKNEYMVICRGVCCTIKSRAEGRPVVPR